MNLFGIGTGELLLILVIALLVLGPERLPEYARKGAILLRRLRSITDEVNRQIREELDLDDLTDIVQETRSTLSDPLGLKQLTWDASQPKGSKSPGSGSAPPQPRGGQAAAVENTIAPPDIADQAPTIGDDEGVAEDGGSTSDAETSLPQTAAEAAGVQAEGADKTSPEKAALVGESPEPPAFIEEAMTSEESDDQ